MNEQQRKALLETVAMLNDMAETEITLEMSRQMFNIDRADVISAAIGMLKVLP